MHTMRKVLASTFVVAVSAFGAGCSAETSDAAIEPARDAVAQPIIGPEQPIITAFGIDTQGRLYQTLLISKKTHAEAVKGTPYTLNAKWAYRGTSSLLMRASLDVPVSELKVAPYKNPEYLVTTVNVTVAKATEVTEATAQISQILCDAM